MNWLELQYRYDDLEPVKNADYRVVFENGASRSGTLDDKGTARLDAVPLEKYTVFYGEDTRDFKPLATLPPNTLAGNAHTVDEARANIHRYIAASTQLKREGSPEQREYLARLSEADDDLSELAAWLPPDLAHGLKPEEGKS